MKKYCSHCGANLRLAEEELLIKIAANVQQQNVEAFIQNGIRYLTTQILNLPGAVTKLIQNAAGTGATFIQAIKDIIARAVAKPEE